MKRSLTVAGIGLFTLFSIGCGIPWSGDEEPTAPEPIPEVELAKYVPAGGPGVVLYDSLDDEDGIADSISLQLTAPDGDIEELMVYGVVAGAGRERPVAYSMATGEAVPLSCLKVSPGRHEATEGCPAFECIALNEEDCNAGHVRPTGYTPPASNPGERGLKLAMAAHNEATRAHERIDSHFPPTPDVGEEPAPRTRRRAAPAPEPQAAQAAPQPDPPTEEPPAQEEPAPDANVDEVEGS